MRELSPSLGALYALAGGDVDAYLEYFGFQQNLALDLGLNLAFNCGESQDPAQYMADLLQLKELSRNDPLSRLLQLAYAAAAEQTAEHTAEVRGHLAFFAESNPAFAWFLSCFVPLPGVDARLARRLALRFVDQLEQARLYWEELVVLVASREKLGAPTACALAKNHLLRHWQDLERLDRQPLARLFPALRDFEQQAELISSISADGVSLLVLQLNHVQLLTMDLVGHFLESVVRLHLHELAGDRAPKKQQNILQVLERAPLRWGAWRALKRIFKEAEARADKDFARSDALRDELTAQGVDVMDGDPVGWEWRLEV